MTRVCTTHPRSEQLQKYIFVAIFVAGDSLPGSVSRGIFAMGAAKALRTIAGLPFGAGLLVNAYVFAAPEPTTPDSPFTLGSSTAATVTSYSPVIGDNGQFPSTTGSIYNLFGATNTSVENNGDIIFGDNNSQPNAVAFTTPAPVYLIGIVAYLDSDNGTLDGPRSVGTVTFTANGSEVVFTVNGSEVVDPAPVNESVAVDGGSNVFMFAQPVMASTFVVTFSANPNFTPDANNDGVGPRIFELDGIVPEPTSLGMLALGALGLFARPRRA